jgi:ascorbate-specific PTS system EIIC-type component UlaA
MIKLTPHHWAVAAALFSGLALQLSGVEHWHEVLTPSWIAGLMLVMGSALAGFGTPDVRSREGKRTRAADRD